MAVQMALLEWYRAAELSADRAATLVNRDPLVTCRTMMVMAGGASSRKLDLDAFIRQAGEYEDWSSGWDKLNRLRSELLLTHSYPVRRVKEIMAWVHSGRLRPDRRRRVPDARPAAPTRARRPARRSSSTTTRFRRIFNEFGGRQGEASKVADAAEQGRRLARATDPGASSG